jgi:hypothetical protein
LTAVEVAANTEDVVDVESESCTTPLAEVEAADTERFAEVEVPAFVIGALTAMIPDEPVGPVDPVGPVAPAGPVAPVTPAGPVGPVGPVAPVGPVGPTIFTPAGHTPADLGPKILLDVVLI